MTARRLVPLGLAALAPALLLLATCAQPPQTAASRANQATVAACRTRAEDIYVSQNRDLIYRNDTSSTPYSAGPNTGIPTHGLSSLFANQQVVDDCVRNTGAQAPRDDNTLAAKPGAPGAASP
jgi:hypothetical protein